MRIRTGVLAALLLATPVGAWAQNEVILGADRYLRVESQAGHGRRGPVVSGYVYNLTGYHFERVRLAIEAVDATGQVTGSTVGYVSGVVPANGRAYFEVPAGTTSGSYRARVTSFEPVGRGSG